MPADPVSQSSAAAVTAVGVMMAASPGASDYALLVFGALVGAMHSVAKVPTPTRMSAALYIIRWVATAGVLTFAVASLLESFLGVPATRWPGVVAFAITFLADRWPQWLSLIVERRIGIPGRSDEGGPGNAS